MRVPQPPVPPWDVPRWGRQSSLPPLAAPRVLTLRHVGDDGLWGDADAAVIDGEVVASQALGPAVVVAAHDGLAAVTGALADGAARLDGVVKELQSADGGVHGTEEEG